MHFSFGFKKNLGFAQLALKPKCKWLSQLIVAYVAMPLNTINFFFPFLLEVNFINVLLASFTPMCLRQSY